MRHARPDYNRIQDPAVRDPSLLGEGGSPIGEDEPVFLLRATDVSAPATVRYWAQMAERSGASPAIVGAARNQADAMQRWQAQNGHKVPDMPEKGGEDE